MKLKASSNNSPIDKNLSDWEILGAISFCNLLLERKNSFMQEFNELCIVMFNGNQTNTVNHILTMKNSYIHEFNSRHLN